MTPNTACVQRSRGLRLHTPPPGDATIGSGSDTDPGDLASRIDPAVCALVHTDHVALDGGPHVTPEALERLEADLLAITGTGGVA